MPSNAYRNACITAWPEQLPTREGLTTPADDDELKTYLEGLQEVEGGLKYAVFGIETCPNTGRRHIQGYVETRQGWALTKFRSVFGRGVHVERRRGTAKEAADYCKKDGFYVEFGNISQQGKSAAQIAAAADAFRQGRGVRELLRQGELDPVIFLRYSNGLERLASYLEPERRETPRTVYILTGPTGTGKTRMAKEAGATLVSLENGFLLSSAGMHCDVVCFDDFEPSDMTRSLFLRLTDRYNLAVNIKGSSTPWRPSTLYFTTNEHPRSWTFKCGRPFDAACMRRVTEIREIGGAAPGVYGAAAANFVQ